MNSGTAASTDSQLYANWYPTGVWQGLFSGAYADGLLDQGGFGYYWSSTAGDTVLAFYLYFHGGFVYPGDYYPKFFGYAVRCAI